MRLSKIASEIAESPTFALNEEARLLRERGEAVINLGIGEPKNKTPLSAVIASAAKLTSGEVKYVAPDGVPSLKRAVVRYTEENYDCLVMPENVIITNGAKQSLFNIFYSILNPDDEVVVLAPYWVSYNQMIKMCLADRTHARGDLHGHVRHHPHQLARRDHPTDAKTRHAI